MSTSREVDNENIAGVISRFAEVTEDDTVRIHSG